LQYLHHGDEQALQIRFYLPCCLFMENKFLSIYYHPIVLGTWQNVPISREHQWFACSMTINQSGQATVIG
jgi:hypothetical protein